MIEPLFKSDKYVNLSGNTKVAIEKFTDVCKKEFLLKKAELEFKKCPQIKNDEYEEYVHITLQISESYDKKIANLY